MTQIPRTNWSKSYHYGFRDCLMPFSREELQSTVATASRLKVLGSRHSFNAIADGDVAIVLGHMPLDPVIEADGGQVSIAGHATYGDLAAFLANHKLAVHNLASLPHISIAGAIATATHGSGDGNGNLATAVSGLEIVTADGKLLTTKRGDPDFDGMVVHLGALGVVTRVTLDTQPAFEVSQSVYEGLGWAALLDNLDAIMATGYSVSVFTAWGDTAGQVWVKSAEPSKPLPDEIFGATLAAVKRHPISGVDPENATDQLGARGLWSDRLSHFKMGFTPSNGDEIQSEFHVPRHHAAAAIEAVASIRKSFAHLAQVAEFRTVAADALWLSPQYKRDTLSMHFTWVRDQVAVETAVRLIEDALAPFDALPHWGKVFSRTPMGGRYPMIARFKQLRERLDPSGKFSNPWLEDVVFS
ncbi:xylitol oxidase [Pararhizobium capsulatum DSM 1112]|uniref:Xylitol oxidase n=1 Tax=Pararhizobium capsulatum DSM 1112 TaxID=1121113 RepID=A0ABU0BWS3_9HYPH|nr:D-arabinono-1,4-lactone oxidase [Pararhizobium capsulatum]MDQ0322713.1 xylitol oxidase [Pararhizobium capsulatum DSM 1112]